MSRIGEKGYLAIVGAALMTIGSGAQAPSAYADGPTARVTVEGVVLGPAKKDGKRWDGDGVLNPQEQQLVAAAVGKFAVSYTGMDAIPVVGMAFGHAVASVTKSAIATDQRPDAQGTAELFIGGRPVGKKVKLGEMVNTFTPQWPGKMEWSGVPLTEDIHIRIVLEDNDDGILKRRPDAIGVVMVNQRDLARAAAAGKVFPVYVGDQSDDQIIAVKVSVLVESDVGSSLPPECEEFRLVIQQLSTCTKLPPETRDALSKSFEQTSAAWASVPPEGMASLGRACKSAAEAVRQSAAGCP